MARLFSNTVGGRGWAATGLMLRALCGMLHRRLLGQRRKPGDFTTKTQRPPRLGFKVFSIFLTSTDSFHISAHATPPPLTSERKATIPSLASNLRVLCVFVVKSLC